MTNFHSVQVHKKIFMYNNYIETRMRIEVQK